MQNLLVDRAHHVMANGAHHVVDFVPGGHATSTRGLHVEAISEVDAEWMQVNGGATSQWGQGAQPRLEGFAYARAQPEQQPASTLLPFAARRLILSVTLSAFAFERCHC